jgi:hypothetical protein
MAGTSPAMTEESKELPAKSPKQSPSSAVRGAGIPMVARDWPSTWHRVPVSPMREPRASPPGYVFQHDRERVLTMRWEQAVIYTVGALMLIGVAASVFQLYGAALVIGFVLMVLSLGDGPHGLKLLYRDVKRHVLGP